MGKAKMASPEQTEVCRELLTLIDQAFNELDSSTQKTFGRYDWRDYNRVKDRLEKNEPLTLKMFNDLVSFAQTFFQINIQNTTRFINED